MTIQTTVPARPFRYVEMLSSKRLTTATTTPAEEVQDEEESHDMLRVAKRFRGGYDLTQEIRLAEIQVDARRMELEHPVRMAEAEAQALAVRQLDPYFRMQRAVELADMEILLAQKLELLEETKRKHHAK